MINSYLYEFKHMYLPYLGPIIMNFLHKCGSKLEANNILFSEIFYSKLEKIGGSNLI